jgi:hypothetical protein
MSRQAVSAAVKLTIASLPCLVFASDRRESALALLQVLVAAATTRGGR